MIELSEETHRRIEYHGEQTYPEECCGILLGFDHDGARHIEEMVEIDNSQDENRRRRFFITPDQYRQAEQTAAELHMDLLGFYHSHPDHPAIPSAFDKEHALPWFAYVIVSIQAGRAAGMAVWQLSEDRSRFLQKEIVVKAAAVRTVYRRNSYQQFDDTGKTQQ
jgi:proteasome lid subunit RPN8/RPN11